MSDSGDTGEVRVQRVPKKTGMGLPRAEEELVLSHPGASPDTPANLVGSFGILGVFLELGGGRWEIGKNKLLCLKAISLESGLTSGASLSRKLWLASQVTTDLLIQPQKVWSCGYSGNCWWDDGWKRGRGQLKGISPPTLFFSE